MSFQSQFEKLCGKEPTECASPVIVHSMDDGLTMIIIPSPPHSVDLQLLGMDVASARSVIASILARRRRKLRGQSVSKKRGRG